MSRNVWIVSDTHFGHKNFVGFKYDGHPARPFDTVEEMDERMISEWNDRVKPEDKVYHLGDVAITRRALEIMKHLNGSRKILIKGNHDIWSLKDYMIHFKDIRSVHRLDILDLSHVPIREDSIAQGRVNAHGHTHKRVIDDKRYINMCVEHWNWGPAHLDEVLAKVKHG